MRPSPYDEYLVNVLEELVKFTLIGRDRSDSLTNWYSKRKEDVPELAPILAAAATGQKANSDEKKDERE